MIATLEEALKRIEELEAENAALKEELEAYRTRNYSGRKKHNAAWMESYTDFEIKYENGMSIMEIVNEGNISRRTAYRYKAYYDELRKMQKEKEK
ncbi:MAG: helix-turn-helix domain-containing protein [Pseudobutyrivibrio sp.]|nr:helix-turn-helix domain-containing protein [Pseudobutyrivibrio sp.]